MHFRRCRVTGSLNGWTLPSETVALADRIIGYEHEDIEVSSEFNHLPTSSAATLNGQYALLPPPLLPPPPLPPGYIPPLPPPGYMHDTSVKVKPLSRKAVDNIFQNALGSYSRLDKEKKFQICDLAIQIERLLLTDSKGSTVEHSSGDLTVDIPSQQLIAKQPKNRLMSAQERAQRQHKRSSRHNPSE